MSDRPETPTVGTGHALNWTSSAIVVLSFGLILGPLALINLDLVPKWVGMAIGMAVYGGIIMVSVLAFVMADAWHTEEP